jgi:hypothetical protein
MGAEDEASIEMFEITTSSIGEVIDPCYLNSSSMDPTEATFWFFFVHLFLLLHRPFG